MLQIIAKSSSSSWNSLGHMVFKFAHFCFVISSPPYQLTQFITLYQCAKPRCVSTIIKPDFSTDFAFAFTIVKIFPAHNARLSCEYLHLPGVLAEFQWSAMMSFRLTLQLLSGFKQNAVLETIFNFINPVLSQLTDKWNIKKYCGVGDILQIWGWLGRLPMCWQQGFILQVCGGGGCWREEENWNFA